jgi:hypothetical protein
MDPEHWFIFPKRICRRLPAPNPPPPTPFPCLFVVVEQLLLQVGDLCGPLGVEGGYLSLQTCVLPHQMHVFPACNIICKTGVPPVPPNSLLSVCHYIHPFPPFFYLLRLNFPFFLSACHFFFFSLLRFDANSSCLPVIFSFSLLRSDLPLFLSSCHFFTLLPFDFSVFLSACLFFFFPLSFWLPILLVLLSFFSRWSIFASFLFQDKTTLSYFSSCSLFYSCLPSSYPHYSPSWP